MGDNQHVVKVGSDWRIKGENNTKYTGTFDTQQQASERAREIAINKQAEVVIHRPNGQIRDKNSYGNDPYPPKG